MSASSRFTTITCLKVGVAAVLVSSAVGAQQRTTTAVLTARVTILEAQTVQGPPPAVGAIRIVPRATGLNAGVTLIAPGAQRVEMRVDTEDPADRRTASELASTVTASPDGKEFFVPTAPELRLILEKGGARVTYVVCYGLDGRT